MIWYYNHFFHLSRNGNLSLFALNYSWVKYLISQVMQNYKFSLEQSCPYYWKYEMLAMKSFWHLLSHINFPSNIVFKMIKKCQIVDLAPFFQFLSNPFGIYPYFFLGFLVILHIPYYPNLTINDLLAVSTVLSLKTIIC